MFTKLDANSNEVFVEQTDLNGSGSGGTADPGVDFTSLGDASAAVLAFANEKIPEIEQQYSDFLSGAASDLYGFPSGELLKLKTGGGNDSFYYRIPKQTWGQLRPDSMDFGTQSDVHEAFKKGSEEAEAVYIAAFPMSLASNDEVVSQPNREPLTIRTIDQAILRCNETDIVGFEGLNRLMSVHDRSLVVNVCMREGYQPPGNTNFGRSHEILSLFGIKTGLGSATLTGSLGVKSSSTGALVGVYDLVGNVSSWMYGVETENGRLKTIDDNMSDTCDRSLLQLKPWWLSDESGALTLVADVADQVQVPGLSVRYTKNGFATLNRASSVHMRRLLLSPVSDAINPFGACWAATTGDKCATVGGMWSQGEHCGLGHYELVDEDTSKNAGIGFRAAFAV